MPVTLCPRRLAILTLLVATDPAFAQVGEQTGQQADKQAAPVVEGPVGTRADDFLRRCEPFGFSGTVLVEKDGKVVLRKGYGLADRAKGIPNTPATLFDIGSLTKQFTAAAILCLEQDGVLTTSDPLGKFFAEVPEDKTGVEIHHLLTHTSGLPRAHRRIGSALQSREKFLPLILGVPMQSKPGERHAYSNIGYDLLGAIVEVASGQPFEKYLRKKLFAPAGMADTGFRGDGALDADRAALGHPNAETVSLPGSSIQGQVESPWEKRRATEGWYSWGLRGAGGVITTVDDLLRWKQALEGTEILSKASLAKLFRPVRDNYAYGWYVLKTKRDTAWIEHGGSTGNGFDVKYGHFPDDGLLVVTLGNVSGVVPWVNLNLVKVLTGEDAAVPPATVALAADRLKPWEGAYEGASGARVRVRAHGGALILEAEDPKAMAMISPPVGPRRPDNLGELIETTVAIAKGLQTDDLAPLEAAVDPNSRFFIFEPMWLNLRKQHGELRESRALGSTVAPWGAATTHVKLSYERGAEIFKFAWQKDGIVSASYGPPYPSLSQVWPTSARDFVKYDLRWSKIRAQVAFRGDADAAIMVLRVGDQEVELERQ